MKNHIDISKEVIYIATFFCKLSEDAVRRVKKKVKAFFHGVKVILHKFAKINLE